MIKFDYSIYYKNTTLIFNTLKDYIFFVSVFWLYEYYQELRMKLYERCMFKWLFDYLYWNRYFYINKKNR